MDPRRLVPLALAVTALGMSAGVLSLGFVAEGRAQEKAKKEKHGGNVIFQVSKPTKTIKDHVLFSHDAHIAAGSACADCHNGKVFQEEKKLGVNRFTMKDINAGKACGACHDGETAGKGGKPVFAPTRNCSRCHNVKLRQKG